jgi:hypothetical protein
MGWSNRFLREKQKRSVDAISSSDARLIPRIDGDLGLTARNLVLALVLSAPVVDALISISDEIHTLARSE